MFLIFASDGLWEQLTDEAAVEIVVKNPRTVRYYILSTSLPSSYLTDHWYYPFFPGDS